MLTSTLSALCHQPMFWALPALAFAAAASAQDAVPEDLKHHEAPDEAPGPARPATAATVPTVSPQELGIVNTFQVNVDAMGNNILGDAGNEPSLGVDPAAPNRIVIGWRQFDTIADSFRQAGNAYSHDGGRTWTNLPPIEAGIFRSDPVIDVDQQGNFYYLSLATTPVFFCDVFISTNGGMSWDGGEYAFGGDKAWFGVDRTGGVGNGNIYHVWSPFFSCCNFPIAGIGPGFARSVDNGDTFQDLDFLPVNIFWGTTAVGPGGELYYGGVTISEDPRQPTIIRSSNAQDPNATVTWDVIEEVDLGGGLSNANSQDPNPAGLLGQIWTKTDTSLGPGSGNVYMAASVTVPDNLHDVMFARSTDGGMNWSPPVRVNDDPIDSENWQWFATMDVAPNGRIDIVWNDTRESGETNICRLYYAFSDDGGATFSPNVAISPEFDSWLGWPQQNKLGDYYELISDNVGAHLAWAATFNGEQDVYYTRIGDYDCNGNGVGDAEDLQEDDAQDCNENDIPDSCEIAAGTVVDANDDGVPDECETDECVGDVNGDGEVSVQDLTALILAWGPCLGCAEDLDGDDEVAVTDLTTMILNWGKCP